MIEKLTQLLSKRKYEILLAALVAHLYIGIFVSDLELYTSVVWPLNMVILGIASVSVFIEAGRFKKIIQNILWMVAFLLPISILFFGKTPYFMIVISVFYCVFFGFILWKSFGF